MFFFHSDREVLAWRGIGNVLRLLQENGSRNSGDLSLHMGSQIASPGEKLYWCVYTLDRRWSFGTDLPFAVHDTEIDRHPMLDVSSNRSPPIRLTASLIVFHPLERLTLVILRDEHGILLPNILRREKMAT